MNTLRRIAGWGAITFTTVGALLWATQSPAISAPYVILGLALSAIWINTGKDIRTYAFSVWVFTAVATAMYYPFAFDTWFEYKLTGLISPLIQIIMFGVGTQLSVSDFTRAFKMPKAVLVGVVSQFLIMPVLGFSIAKALGFEGEVAAGIILVGSCSGGVASNVMAYIAGANVALSVTITSITTLMAPFMTPLAMKVLAQQYVTIDFGAMMIDILWMIITPVVAGLIVNKLLHGRAKWFDSALPTISMMAIVFIISIITASSRDKLLQVGALLIVAAVIHNLCGYMLGYWGGRLLGLVETDCRVVAFEVGMQNGGMGSALAINVLQSSDAALAPAIFGPWMNISGSVLASFGRKRQPAEAAGVESAEEPARRAG